jgi:hypothetical protein
MYQYNSVENVKDSIAFIDNFSPNKKQTKAIESRNYNLANNLGVTFDQYMLRVSPKYRAKLARIC